MSRQPVNKVEVNANVASVLFDVGYQLVDGYARRVAVNGAEHIVVEILNAEAKAVESGLLERINVRVGEVRRVALYGNLGLVDKAEAAGNHIHQLLKHRSLDGVWSAATKVDLRYLAGRVDMLCYQRELLFDCPKVRFGLLGAPHGVSVATTVEADLLAKRNVEVEGQMLWRAAVRLVEHLDII